MTPVDVAGEQRPKLLSSLCAYSGDATFPIFLFFLGGFLFQDFLRFSDLK